MFGCYAELILGVFLHLSEEKGCIWIETSVLSRNRCVADK